MQPRHASTLVSQALNVPDPADQPAPEEGSIECPQPSRFGFLFPELQTDEALLPEGRETIKALVALGKTMIDKQPLDKAFDTTIPSIYTYFGQFIVHDLTFDSMNLRLFEDDVENLNPFSSQEINAVANPRRGLLDLDSVYGPILENNRCYRVPRNGEGMRVEIAASSDRAGTDLPRREQSPYKALIGDHRNDENLIISQLHLAFLNAHNFLVRAGASYERAKELLQRRYQYLVINDFLPRVVDAKDIAWSGANRIFPPGNEYFIPVEFAVGAFRFGHAMVRSEYLFNAQRKTVRLYELFTMTAIGGYHHLLNDWLINWDHFLPGGVNVARNLAPRLVEPLAEFLVQGITVPANGGRPRRPILSLAVIDLIRGYLFRLPTGQAVAHRLGLLPMTDTELEEVATAVSTEQAKVLRDTGLLKRTPLWYYVLAEAAHPKHGNGNRLGPVGGRLVASVLLEAAMRSQAALPSADGWDPILGNAHNFNLGEVLRRADINFGHNLIKESSSWR